MKEKEEDDDSKPNESMQINPSADLLVHVELEQMSNCSSSQLKPAKGRDVFNGVCYPTNYYMIHLLSEQNLWWFL